ncbi:MAG TPA: FAD-binding oxidoreductase [Gammaproteobacteria bacterium]|nr:FAD-binding oxidoreductase [Gammaproteobacteria bacterium]
MVIFAQKMIDATTPLNVIFFSLFMFFECALASQPLPCFPFSPLVLKQLKDNGVTLSHHSQVDYGKLKVSATCYLEAWPRNTTQIAKLVKIAYQHNIPIRTQGARHSQNGISLPMQHELLIHTTTLNHIRFSQDGSLVVESGVPVALINPIIQRYSKLFIPIFNGGGIGPTVGGYISAGGISPASEEYGGFWEHVRAITIVTGYGNLLHIRNHHPLFLWLFGAMGQLGIITEAELEVIPLDLLNPITSFTTSLLPENFATTVNMNSYNKKQNDPLYWFNLFVTADQLAQAKHRLQQLQNRYPDALSYIPLYQWQVSYIDLMPPLVFNQHRSFIAIGIWGKKGNRMHSQDQFNKLSEAFSQLVNETHYRRYIQSESSSSPKLYKQYFDTKTYSEFRKIKLSLDPKLLFNQNSFFEP